jgi:hypothetical protein
MMSSLSGRSGEAATASSVGVASERFFERPGGKATRPLTVGVASEHLYERPGGKATRPLTVGVASERLRTGLNLYALAADKTG